MCWQLILNLMVGTGLGMLAGIGVGGGSLLILWLTLGCNMDSTISRGINLLFFLPCALIASIFRAKQGSLNVTRLLPGILSGCLCAAVSSWVAMQLDVSVLKKLFGILLLFTGARELLYKPRQ